jgi:hypothetical protein
MKEIKMKLIVTVLSVVLIVFFTNNLLAQQRPAPKYSPPVTGEEQPDLSSNPILNVTKGYTFAPVYSGGLTFDIHAIDPTIATGYDFQTNNAAQSIWMDANNPDFLHAAFTVSQQTSGWSDRTCYYYGSTDAGVNWFQLGQVPVYISPTDGRSGFAVVYGTSTGAAVIANHNNTGGGEVRSKVYIDAGPFEYNFTEYDPDPIPWEVNSPIWTRMVVDQSDNVIFIASQSTTSGAADSSFTNVLVGSVYDGWNTYNGHQAEAYAIAISESGAKLGMIYEGQGLTGQYSDILYRESTDGGLSWSTPLMIWDADQSNPDSIVATWRGMDLEFLGEDPRAVFEIGVISSNPEESYYPGYPSSIYFWSPNINGGNPFAIADQNNVPFYTNERGNSDAAFNMGKPCIGRSQVHSHLFVAFAAAGGEIWTQTPDSTAYFKGYFMYSTDGGATWTNPVVFTPDGPPTIDWRYPAIVPVSSVPPTDDDIITVQMTMQADSVPGSNLGAAGTTMPLTVSAQFYQFTTQITVVGVDEEPSVVNSFNLEQNYPNPFNPKTNIKFRIAESGLTTLKVYDILGNEINTLVNEEKQAGSYELEFDASGLTSGVYFYKLQSGNKVETKKLVLMK